MSNATVRRRFGIEDQNAADASRILKEAVENGAIAIENLSAGTKSRTYLPFWANPTTGEFAEFV